MRALLYNELYKLFKKPRTYISPVVIAVIIMLINLGMYLEGEQILEFLLKTLREQFFLEGNILNGYLVVFLCLTTLWVHIPFLLVIVTADLMSSEFETGAIRMILTRPVKRSALMTAKLLTATIYVALFMLFLGAVAYVGSTLTFGTGDIIVLYEGIQIITEAQFLPRFVLAMLYATFGMAGFAAMSVYISTATKNSLAAILITMGVLIVSTLLQTFSLGIFESWKPFLFSYHMTQWQLIFYSEIPWGELIGSIIFLLFFTGVFVALSYRQINRLNITE
jgi:ABC-2 type transport system permease protein